MSTKTQEIKVSKDQVPGFNLLLIVDCKGGTTEGIFEFW